MKSVQNKDKKVTKMDERINKLEEKFQIREDDVRKWHQKIIKQKI